MQVKSLHSINNIHILHICEKLHLIRKLAKANMSAKEKRSCQSWIQSETADLESACISWQDNPSEECQWLYL